MGTALKATGLQLRSLITSGGDLEVSLTRVPVPAPGPEEVVVRIEAAPINPSDLGLLLGPADLATAESGGDAENPVIRAKIPPTALSTLAGRLDTPMPVGNEGAGVVSAAGESAGAQALLGRTVAFWGGGSYAQYRTLKAADCLLLPEGTSPAQGASCFVNPLTALGMVEAMRREGHTALVHTAAASNLGQMLNRLCLADGIGLVNIVRSPGQVEILKQVGAVHVCDSTAPSFRDDLRQALAQTGATLAFDAVGGGRLADEILSAMEAVANMSATGFSRYGSSTHKQVYIYGALDVGRTELRRTYGLAWGVGGWLISQFLQKIGPVETERLRRRIVAEITTIFASHFAQVVSLPEALQLDNLAAYSQRSTGGKYLINPNKAG